MNYLEKLEYNKILNILKKYAKTYIGINKIEKMNPLYNSVDVSNLLLQTSTAFDIITKYGQIPIDSFSDVAIHIKKLNNNNSLCIKEILDLVIILKISRKLKEYFYEISKNNNNFNVLASYFNNLYTNYNLEKEINYKIINENTIYDKASEELYSIRKNIISLEHNIKDKLYHFIHSATYSKYLMEPIITIRNNRYVIPVKDEYRSNIQGLIHDISSSGSTVFIEPTSIFEMNNEINSLKIKETIEIEKILSILSSKLSNYVSEIKINIELLGTIDFIFAKANYSIEINGIFPKINNTKSFNLIKARHPLIAKNKVVPINISLGENYTSLVITGPNTGRKNSNFKNSRFITTISL